MEQDKKISIIIKALDEEEHIAKCIESALAALKKVKGDNEIILVDSGSKDNTLKIAQRYPIKIYQLKSTWTKSPAAALQTGYLHSKGKYIYVLDGDMYLERDSLKNLLPYLKQEKVAGVAGLMKEPPVNNIISERFQKRRQKYIKTGFVKFLNGGGLYKRSAVEQVGYLANPYLNSAEEAELGYRLAKKGYKLLRIKKSTVIHNTYIQPTSYILKRKWKLGYMKGPGQVLGGSFNNIHFLYHIFVTRFYLTTILWWFVGIISFFLSLFLGMKVFFIYLLCTILLFIALLIKKRSIIDVFYSIFSWSVQGLGILIGIFEKQKNPNDYPKDARVIKQ